MSPTLLLTWLAQWLACGIVVVGFLFFVYGLVGLGTELMRLVLIRLKLWAALGDFIREREREARRGNLRAVELPVDDEDTDRVA